MIVDRVSNMNLLDMRVYANNKLDGFGICEDGLCEIMRKVNSKDTKTGKAFIQNDAMDSKKKKAFDLVIIVASSSKVTIVLVELIQEFIDSYQELILKFDTDNKQIYGDKLKTALNGAIETISTMTELNRKMKIIGS